MAAFAQFDFEDGTSVLVEVVQDPEPPSTSDLPSGTEPLQPVTRPGEILRKTGAALADVLQPLVPVLEAVHKTVGKAAVKPDEISVQVGLKLTTGMNLMIVGGNGEASITVAAKWNLTKETKGTKEASGSGTPSPPAPATH